MSVGIKAGVEEARFRLTLMTMSGCSISFSDDFRPLGLAADPHDAAVPAAGKSRWPGRWTSSSGNGLRSGTCTARTRPARGTRWACSISRTSRSSARSSSRPWAARRRRGRGVRVLGGEVPWPHKDRVTLSLAAADRPHPPDPSPADPPASDRHQHARAGRIPRDRADGLGRGATACSRASTGGRRGWRGRRISTFPTATARCPTRRRPRARPPEPSRQEPVGAGGPLRAAAA